VTNDRPGGTEYIASVRCGAHISLLRNSHEELADTLAPYFAAGIQQDEFCLWVTSDPMGVEGAGIGLRKAAPYLARYLDGGQIEILDSRDWYLRGGHFDADRVFAQWTEKEKQALDAGYKGLRVSGDTAWLQKQDWTDFMDYEAEVNRDFPQHRLTGLCTYPLDSCPADGVLEIVRNHQLTLAKVAGEWEMIESSSFGIAKAMSNEQLPKHDSVSEQLRRLSADVLEQKDNERRWIANQLHEVTAQNVSAIALNLAGLQQRRSWPSAVKSLLAKCHTMCEQSVEQILTLSHLLHPPILDTLGLPACLRQYIEDFMKRSRIHVEFETGREIGRLPPHVETHLFRVAQEGLANILRHSGSFHAVVRLHRLADQVILQIEDFGGGIPSTATAAVAGDAGQSGLGILGMQERLRKIGGHLEIQSCNQGTLLTASIRLS